MGGIYTLFLKELLRFRKVSLQTVMAPVVTTLLYLLIFSQVLQSRVQVYSGVSYTAFLIPGLVMMTMLQNSFANCSSSLIQSKMTGNILFILLPPLTYWEFFSAFVGAAIVRGLVVGVGVYLGGLIFAFVPLTHPWWALIFALLGCGMLGSIGIIASLWADDYDQMSAVQSFFIVPLTFLSGVFYSIHSLPVFWQKLSNFNPFFYLIDGFRYGFFGESDVSPLFSILIVSICFLALSSVTLALLKRGYKLRG